MNNESTASIDLAQLDKLEALARASETQGWYGIYQLADGVTDNLDAAFITAANPATVQQLIALARRSLTSGAPAGLLNAEELAALRRFDECAQDGEGYDVPKAMMQRLAEIGVVQRRSGAYYQATEFGVRVLAAPVHDAAAPSNEQALADMEARKDAAYYERNQVVAALAKCFPSGVARTAIEGWSEDWHGCVYIDLPTGQVSWHFHDSQAHLFAGLPPYAGKWDGHDTPEKYRRVGALEVSAGAAAKTDHAPVGYEYQPRHENGMLLDWTPLTNADNDEEARAYCEPRGFEWRRSSAAGAGSDQAKFDAAIKRSSRPGAQIIYEATGVIPSAPSVTVQDERALFEAWAPGNVTSLVQGKFGTGYVYADTVSAWKAWQARAAHPVQDGEKDAAHASDGEVIVIGGRRVGRTHALAQRIIEAMKPEAKARTSYGNIRDVLDAIQRMSARGEAAQQDAKGEQRADQA